MSFSTRFIFIPLPIQTEKVLSLPVFESVKDILFYVQREAANATTGASIILVLTTLYSSSNLFYQMRKSGELIYDYHAERQGLKIRLSALVLLIVVMATMIGFLLVFALGSFLFSRLLSQTWERVADYLLLAGVAFFLVLLLNVYVFPFKMKARAFLLGTVVTVGAWALALVGFSIYLKVSNVRRLYGALSTIIVFLLWLYILMIGFIVGVILNSERILKKNKKKKLRNKTL